jgi:hypothetical protein
MWSLSGLTVAVGLGVLVMLVLALRALVLALRALVTGRFMSIRDVRGVQDD